MPDSITSTGIKGQVMLEFIHMPENRRRLLGPFGWVQMTYDIVRAGLDNDEREIGRTKAGTWHTYDDGQDWTDVSVWSTDSEIAQHEVNLPHD